MKKLRKLRLNDEQKLSQKEQDMVLAGWQGPCYCKNVGDNHLEWQDTIRPNLSCTPSDLLYLRIYDGIYGCNPIFYPYSYPVCTIVREYRVMQLAKVSPKEHIEYARFIVNL